jgi:site-specific DNA-methyltransferase (adenine-specific)
VEAQTLVSRVYRQFSGRVAKGRIRHEDALDFLHSLRPECADLIFLDPPFNLGKVYGSNQRQSDLRPPGDYQTWMFKVLALAARALAPGGTLYLYHVPQWALRVGAYLDTQLTFQHWIAISMKNGFARGNRLYPAHYALLMFSKGQPTVLRRPKVAARRCASCGDFFRSYGGYRSIIEKQGGVNLSDFWDDLSPVRHASRKHRSSNELPAELLRRVLLISGVPGGVYVDPFAGAGAGVIAAAQIGMQFYCCDNQAENCAVIARRLETLIKETKSSP